MQDRADDIGETGDQQHRCGAWPVDGVDANESK
jgi:hypothetical protein